jgi:hypothetical protein
MTDDLVTEARKGGPCAELGDRCRAIEAASGCFCAAVADRIEQLTAQLESTLRDRKLILEERDRTFALMLARAEKAEADNVGLRERFRYADLHVEALSEMKAIMDGLLKEIQARPALNTGKEPSHE